LPTAPEPEAWEVIYYQASDEGCPADEFLDGCPTKVSAQLIAVITGMRKPWLTAFSERDYDAVRRLGEDHRNHFPRRIKLV